MAQVRPPGPPPSPPPELDSQEDLCPICLDLLDFNVATTPCQHRFHRDCLARWRRVRPACPMCQGELQAAPASAAPAAPPRGRRRRPPRRACAGCRAWWWECRAWWWGCARALGTLAFFPAIIVVVFYTAVYTGKTALWCLSHDNHHNATRANATRHIDWSPASVHFGYIFMGVVVFVMCGLALTLARVCCCAR